jgi:hypothetical protein
MLNPTIFGNTDSARVLAEILEKTPQHKRKVFANFNEYNQVMNEIADSNLSTKLKKNFLKVTLDRFRLKTNRFEGPLKTFSMNVLSQIYRKHLAEL